MENGGGKVLFLVRVGALTLSLGVDALRRLGRPRVYGEAQELKP